MFSSGFGLGIGIVDDFLELLQEVAVARCTPARLLGGAQVLLGEVGQLRGGAVGVVPVEELLNSLHVLGFYVCLPLTQRAGGSLESGLRGHMASTQGGVGERFLHEVATALGLLDVVLAPLADGQPICSLLRGDE